MSLCTQCQGAEDGGDPNYPGLCGVCAWRKWFASVGNHWNDVECIECELGRDCELHPQTAQE